MVHDKEYEGNIVFKEEERSADKRTRVMIYSSSINKSWKS